MTKYEVVPSTTAHASHIASTMREADVREVWAAAHASPMDALERSMSVSRDTNTGLADGEPVCMFGTCRVSMLSPRATVWMLASSSVEDHALAFLRRNKAFLRSALEEYTELFNFVDARNVKAIQWLKWLGFTLEDPTPYGADRLPFHPFFLRR